MSHLRPEDISVGHKKSQCKKGHHRYGEGQSIGGGILRQICVICGAVSIDLTGVEPVGEAEAAPLGRTDRRGST
jgi:hypothetical protein